VRGTPVSNRRRVPGPPTLGELVQLDRLDDRSPGEWMALLPDGTEVVLADIAGIPSPRGVEKAVAIVQSRIYLEGRARQILLPFTTQEGTWRLVTVDFGVEAQRAECEFLMCFAFQSDDGELSVSSPFAEVAFELHMHRARSPSLS